MIQSSDTECRRYLPRHYLNPKYVLLLTFFNLAAEGVVTTDNCTDRTSEMAGFHSVDVEVWSSEIFTLCSRCNIYRRFGRT